MEPPTQCAVGFRTSVHGPRELKTGRAHTVREERTPVGSSVLFLCRVPGFLNLLSLPLSRGFCTMCIS